MVRLQGKLEVVVIEARDLPNLDFSKRHPDNLSDPYVSVQIVGSKKKKTKFGKTHTIDDSLNPKWNYALQAEINEEVHEIVFEVKDKDKIRSQTIGSCSIGVHAFNHSTTYERMLNLVNGKGSPAGYLKVMVKFSGSLGGEMATYRPFSVNGCVVRKQHQTDRTDYAGPPAFLHGKLVLEIHSAEGLPNLDMTLLKAGNKSDPFATASLVDEDGNAWKVAATKCIQDDLNPVWNETFSISVCHEVSSLLFKVYDQDTATKDKIGSVEIPMTDIKDKQGELRHYDLVKSGNHRGRLRVKFELEKHSAPGPDVPDCPYSLRSGNQVKLYQDAHCPALPLQVVDASGHPHVPNSTWVDMYNSLKGASKIIFITGWSVKASIVLIRDQNGDGETLKQILWKKADEGVDVRLLLWDEISSTESMQAGAMSTFDNETKEQFKGSGVKVSLALRKKKTKGVVADSSLFTNCCYSHHQKTIIVDTVDPSRPGNPPHLVAYVGGLDLTAGRYDTPDHPLFSTLNTVHRDDFYNSLVSTTKQSGPRQPWHDIHSKISGPAAKDVLKNFDDRWAKQGDVNTYEVNLDGIDLHYKYHGQDHWDVQIFRSISEDSLKLDDVYPSSLSTKKGRKIDNSLQRAYIHQIRKAERFIYIENQYFMGSSHLWENCRDIAVKNLIPLEIAQKICEKIEQGQQFVTYIVIPMFPEGNPEGVAVQEMLHWQFHTIEMMYSQIAKALAKTGSNARPQDYLLFFCVGKREDQSSVPDDAKQPLDKNALLAFNNCRSMIYVHSKMAIFDDEYIIVGSANINDRSLGGTRDTEIAMGAHQPLARYNGEVATFRRCLWAEHLGVVAPLHLNPGTQECARRVHKLAENALIRYMDVSPDLPSSHLLLYPLTVEGNGVVTSRSDCKVFPDTNASVVGVRSKVLPSELTT